MGVRFAAYRVLPFLVLLLFDVAFFGWAYGVGAASVSDRTVRVLYFVYVLMPFVILLAGGYAARRVEPRSAFSAEMIWLSSLVALFHPVLALGVASELGLFEW